MLKRFMRALSLQPVIDKETGKLHSRIETIIAKMTDSGQDPMTQFRACVSYLDDNIYCLKRDNKPSAFVIRNKNPQKANTLAWYTYMRDKLGEIIGVLAQRRIDEMLSK